LVLAVLAGQLAILVLMEQILLLLVLLLLVEVVAHLAAAVLALQHQEDQAVVAALLAVKKLVLLEHQDKGLLEEILEALLAHFHLAVVVALGLLETIVQLVALALLAVLA
jgi:hypothetical protein